MLKPICVACERFMRMKKSGHYFTEGMPTIECPNRGKGAAGWVDYKIWAGDLWACPTCGQEIIVGTGTKPVREHYESDFAEIKIVVDAGRLLVKDC